MTNCNCGKADCRRCYPPIEGREHPGTADFSPEDCAMLNGARKPFLRVAKPQPNFDLNRAVEVVTEQAKEIRQLEARCEGLMAQRDEAIQALDRARAERDALTVAIDEISAPITWSPRQDAYEDLVSELRANGKPSFFRIVEEYIADLSAMLVEQSMRANLLETQLRTQLAEAEAKIERETKERCSLAKQNADLWDRIHEAEARAKEERRKAFEAARMAFRTQGFAKEIPGMLTQLGGDNCFVYENATDYEDALKEARNENNT